MVIKTLSCVITSSVESENDTDRLADIENKFTLPKGKGAKELGINIYSPGHTQRIIYKIDNQRGPTV